MVTGVIFVGLALAVCKQQLFAHYIIVAQLLMTISTHITHIVHILLTINASHV